MTMRLKMTMKAMTMKWRDRLALLQKLGNPVAHYQFSFARRSKPRLRNMAHNSGMLRACHHYMHDTKHSGFHNLRRFFSSSKNIVLPCSCSTLDFSCGIQSPCVSLAFHVQIVRQLFNVTRLSLVHAVAQISRVHFGSLAIVIVAVSLRIPNHQGRPL